MSAANNPHIMIERIQTIILGQGLAGTALAWTLRQRGEHFIIVDRGDDVTSSRVAAGLITPVVGKRFTLSSRWTDQWATANTFYQQAEQATDTRFFFPCEMLRLFATPAERSSFKKRQQTGKLDHIVDAANPTVNDDSLHAPHGGFSMRLAGRLDVATYLDASRDWFQQRGHYRRAAVDLHRDIVITEAGVELAKLHLRARRIVFCQGIAARENPWFRGVRFEPAKGEILTLRIDNMHPRRILHGQAWLAPQGAGVYRAGATYDRDHLDEQPTDRGRVELEARLRKFVKRALRVTDHQAAVRPIIAGRLPVAGVHPQYRQLAYINGLGSKGSIHAPWVAQSFADDNVSPDINLTRRFTVSPCD